MTLGLHYMQFYANVEIALDTAVLMDRLSTALL